MTVRAWQTGVTNATYTNGNRTAEDASAGGFGSWIITKGDGAIANGDKVIFFIKMEVASGGGGTPTAGVVVSSYGGGYPGNVGTDTDSVGFRGGDSIYNGSGAGGSSNWNTGYVPGPSTVVAIVKVDRTVGVKTVSCYSYDNTAYNSVDLTPFGSADLYPAYQSGQPGDKATVMTRAEVVSFGGTPASELATAEGAGFSVYSDTAASYVLSASGSGVFSGVGASRAVGLMSSTAVGAAIFTSLSPDTLIFDTSGAHTPDDGTFSNGDKTFNGDGTTAFGDWEIVQGNRSIAIGEAKLFVVKIEWDGSTEGPPHVGLAKSTIGHNYPAQLGGTGSLAWRGGDILMNAGTPAESQPNWNSGTSLAGQVHYAVLACDRRDSAAQTAMLFSLDHGSFNTPIDITSLFGTTDPIYPTCVTNGPSSAVTFLTQAEIEADPGLAAEGHEYALQELWIDFQLEGYEFLSAPYTNSLPDPLDPVVFTKPGLDYFVRGGWNHTIAEFTACAADGRTNTEHFEQLDWVEGPNTVATVKAGLLSAGLKGICSPGMRWDPAHPFGEEVEINDYVTGAATLIADTNIVSLHIHDELDLFWGGGIGPSWASPTNQQAIIDAWKADNGGSLGGKMVESNLTQRGQLAGEPFDGQYDFMELPDLTISGCDGYPRSDEADTNSIYGGIGGTRGLHISCLFTSGLTGWTTYTAKFGPQPNGSTAIVGRPHFEWVQACQVGDLGRYLNEDELRLLWWSAVIMGCDGIDWWDSKYTSVDSGRLKWEGPALAFALAQAARMALLQSDGVLMKTSGEGGGRCPMVVRRSAVAYSPGDSQDRGPTVDSGIVWTRPLSKRFLPGGWQVSKVLTTDLTTRHRYIAQNMEFATRDITDDLDPDDPWYDVLSVEPVYTSTQVKYLDELGVSVPEFDAVGLVAEGVGTFNGVGKARAIAALSASGQGAFAGAGLTKSIGAMAAAGTGAAAFTSNGVPTTQGVFMASATSEFAGVSTPRGWLKQTSDADAWIKVT